jgi:mannose-1-phosphate guanylyltransferase
VPLLQGRSLLDIAVARATSVVPAAQVWLGAGEQLRAAVSAVEGLQADRLVVEPSGRDTLPAVALGCAVIAAADPDAVVAVLTADHLIEPLDSFAATLDAAFALAESRDDALVTFGSCPDHAATGFGYLELGEPLPGGGNVVSTFREKPTLSVASDFLAAGPGATSGTAACSCGRRRRCCARSTPSCRSRPRCCAPWAPPTDAEWEPLARDAWPTLAKLSIDYGVMEPARPRPSSPWPRCPLAARWLDVGSWPAYGEALDADEDGNRVGAAKAVLHASRGNVVASSDPEHLVTLVGCEGLVVVHTPTATLVMPAADASGSRSCTRGWSRSLRILPSRLRQEADWQRHEHRAWRERVQRTGHEFRYAGLTMDDEQVWVRVTRPPTR